MRTSTQVLAAILGITILAQVVFGAVAYWITLDSSHDRRIEMLAHYASEILFEWSESSASPDSADTLAELQGKFHLQRSIVLLRDMKGRLHTAGIEGVLPSALRSIINEQTDKTGGIIDLDGEDYLWSRVESGQNKLALVLLEPVSLVEQAIVSKLGIRLLVTAGVVIWMAVWVALLLSSIISKRLNDKNLALRHQALHDNLTGLPNRNLLYDRLNQVRLTAHRKGQCFALFIMDLDRFKEVNDTLGHQFGDQLLQEVSHRIQESIRENDSVARLGGDEFAVVLPDTSQDGAVNCAMRITRNLESKFNINDVRIEAKASIGIAMYPDHGTETEELLQHADVAMYQAKQCGSGYAVYNQTLDSHSVQRLRLMSDLREAIENDQLSLHFQPIIDLEINRIFKFEALARWNHPEQGYIPPDVFIPMAEQMGLIRILTLWVVDRALSVCRQYSKAGYALNMSINLSTYCLQDTSFPGELRTILDENDVSSECVVLEITESALMNDIKRAREVLDRLHNMGLKLAIDDFGTGFSSLSYLKQLPVHELKIDKSFIIDMEKDESNTTIVHTVIDLGHNLGYRIVAEGVENELSLAHVRAMGCDYAQGYYFSRPLPEAELELWLQESAWAALKKNKSLAVN